jgi:crotonobetainyl-CoA:carnitine CoA-transferase CaiB-like acyl-CoA transferase
LRRARDALGGGKDHLILAVGNDSQFAKVCQVAGRAELSSDPRFARNRDRVRNRGILVPLLEEIFMTRAKSVWVEALEAGKVPCGPINNLGEVFADPQVRARGMVHEWQHPLRGGLRLVANPIKMSATPMRADRPPPLLGEHTEEILSELACRSHSRQRE